MHKMGKWGKTPSLGWGKTPPGGAFCLNPKRGGILPRGGCVIHLNGVLIKCIYRHVYIMHISYTLGREYRVMRKRYSRLLFTSENGQMGQNAPFGLRPLGGVLPQGRHLLNISVYILQGVDVSYEAWVYIKEAIIQCLINLLCILGAWRPPWAYCPRQGAFCLS